VFAQAQAALALGNQDDAIAHWERCIEMGDALPLRRRVGAGTHRPRIALAELYMLRGELQSARALLDWCLAEHPDFIGLIDPYATVLLRSGAAPDTVVGQIEAQLPRLTPAARFMLALLGQRRYSEAAAESPQIDDAEAYAGLAARIELWSRIAGGDLKGAAVASLRAAKLGVSAAEREVFAAWLEIAAGTENAPRSLPVAATPLLGVILEWLLRAQDFDAFERLIPLLRSSALPEREQRELLGSTYLAQGFLPQAAQEWMAVCATTPDARALLGLARVAHRHGQLDDAAVFAGEVLQQRPGQRCRARASGPLLPGRGPEVALSSH
jgi:tetratricopeptide (TPR) repeat protein